MVGKWKYIWGSLDTRRFRAEVVGRIIECRIGAWGRQTVLVDGTPVSDKLWAGLSGSVSHFFAIVDSEGKTRNCEVRPIDRLGGLLPVGKVEVVLDGRTTVTLLEVTRDLDQAACPRCGYSLQGLEPENDEIKCPECGRHTPTEMLR